MKKFLSTFLMCLCIAVPPAFANKHMDFTIHKLESGKPGNTLLVIGGIQGDEPGGFNAASLLVTRYKINKGSVWVVPNLNFISIIRRTRGVYGDLNRKFATLRQSDPEYSTIARIKALILDERVDLVLNLHDGSGFYRPVYLDRTRNPNRWGQCIIIDQERIESRFGNLDEVAGAIVNAVNRHVLSEEHRYHVKNTWTRLGNDEMAKTLTYYAVCNLKPAFGVEVSKSFPTHKRAYYHLQALEAYMDLMGIEYERTFTLSANGVREAINSNIRLAFYDKRIFLDVSNARKRLGYIPLKSSSKVVFRPSNPLIAVVESGKGYRVFHGNRRITRLHPQYFEYDEGLETITMQIDGEEERIHFGEMVNVTKSFLVIPKKGYRVNVIGFKKSKVSNESGIKIRQQDIMTRFSIDRSGDIYRVEVYKENKFAGMVLVNFSKDRDLLVSEPSKVSLLGVPERSGAPSTDSSKKTERDSHLSR